MKWFNRLWGHPEKQQQALIQSVQRQFALFHELLEAHKSALKQISRLEEKQQQGQISDLYALWSDFIQIREGVNETIERMIELGGDRYLALRNRLAVISTELEELLPVGHPLPKDDFTIPFARLSKDSVLSVGTKNAHLGELKSQLRLPVPEGFAISAWAYKHFLDANKLQERFSKLLKGVQIRSYQDLEIMSEDLREAVTRRPVPDDLANALYEAFDDLARRTGSSGFALRSSAVGEDTSFSFAGQYLSFLNVHRDDLLERYKQVLASKFTPSAIYYLLSRSLSNMDFGMGAVCMEMVEAASSGVLYTVDPLNPESAQVVINSVFGLGSYLVDGTLTPDVFHVSRANRQITFSKINQKPLKLALGSEKGVESLALSEADQNRASLNERQLQTLTDYALLIEASFGAPQDVEWAVDQAGKIFLLQTRPLRLLESKPAFNIPDEYKSQILCEGGTPICPGLGMGSVYHLTSVEDLDRVPSGAVLITTNPTPYLVAVMHKINALVTSVGGNTSHLATLARELGVPTVVGLSGAQELPPKSEVTVDASRGVIYAGRHPEWIPTSTSVLPTPELTPASALIRKVIAPIVHLNVIHPSDPRFTPENCRTLHDVLRFVHQKSMEEIFTTLRGTSNKDKIGLRLKTKIPLWVNVIYLDQDYLAKSSPRWVAEQDIQSPPMQALWGGILEEGWPQTHASADVKGFMAVVGANIQEGHKPEFSENSYAFLSQEYMLLNLRMGYHFSTIEAMATSDPEKNYIRMQFKLGGAPLERRMRRIWLISELLRLMGFENASQSDFLDSSIAYQTLEGTLDRLRLLGRITILTKQLDMALSSDARARWYFQEFAKKLELKTQGE